MIKSMMTIAALLTSVIIVRCCGPIAAEDRISALDAHIRLLIEAKRHATTEEAAQELNAAIAAAALDRTAVYLQ